MIKRNKDVDNIPRSLQTDAESIRVNPARTTNIRRLELISAQSYIDEDKYNCRYKTRDIKDKLKEIHPTCCFCGANDQCLQVEHYRPKSKYYWLAYSWDNLLLSCPMCNQAKKVQFEIAGEPVSPKVDNDVSNINNLSEIYDIQEEPLLINPEKVSQREIDSFLYHKDGHVTSDHPRVKYTIKVCELDRPNLVEARKTILDSFIAKINERLYDYKDNQIALEASINSLIKDFVMESKDVSKPFTAFRRYAVKVGWLQSSVSGDE